MNVKTCVLFLNVQSNANSARLDHLFHLLVMYSEVDSQSLSLDSLN